MNQLGVAVVGTGFGARVHVPALRAAGFDVRALVGRNPERTSRRAARVGVERACVTLTDALALRGVDAVTISAPPAEHAGLAMEAIDAGRHVICEKPFALDAAEGAEVLRAARQAGIVHALGHELRWFPERVAIGRAIRTGRIGEPRLVSVVDFVALLTDPAIRMPTWFYDARAGGGWLGASGSHAIDMIRLWLGDFEQVSATTCVTDPGRGDADDSFTMQFQLRSGALGVIQQTGASWGNVRHTVVSGTAGAVGIGSGGTWLADAEGRRELPLDASSPANASGSQLENMTSHELPAYTKLADTFARAIRGEDPDGEVPLPTFVDGVKVMEVMDAARRSAAAGGAAVTVPSSDV